MYLFNHLACGEEGVNMRFRFVKQFSNQPTPELGPFEENVTNLFQFESDRSKLVGRQDFIQLLFNVTW